MKANTTLLITKDPSHPLAPVALRYAKAFLEKNAHHLSDKDASADNAKKYNTADLKLFFYADGAHLSNRLRWQSADQQDLTQAWQTLAKQYKIPLPVCVSTALSRGVSDNENSARHQLSGDNLASGFELVGLSELAMMLQSHGRLISF